MPLPRSWWDAAGRPAAGRARPAAFDARAAFAALGDLLRRQGLHGARIGLDAAQFSDCLESGRYVEAVRADLALGQARGVRSTPSFFLNGQLLVGAQPLQTFNSAIAAIQEYSLRSWSLVKLGTTAAQKKLFFNLRRLKGEMQALDEGDLKPEQARLIAEKLNVTDAEVYSMNGRMSGSDASLNVPMGTDGDMEWQDWLADDEPGQAETFANRQELDSRMELLTRSMEDLSERERHILTERRLIDEPKTLEELSDQYGVSRERIRQIEVRAFEKLQKTMKRLAREQGLPVGD
jgi:hypothetical protein